MKMANKELVTKSKTIRDLLLKPENVEQFKMALPNHITAERFSRIALTTIMQNESLLNCDAASIMKSLIQSASLGLEVDGTLGHAYLIPYAGKATFQVGYKGLIALARRSGEVKSFCAQVVYSEDYFEFQYGTQEQLIHKPSKSDRGEMMGAYAIVHFKDGGYSFDYMSKPDIDKIRKRSKSATSGPWVTDYDEMARKTVAKRLSKYLSLSTEFQQAAQLDEHYDLGLDEPIPSKAEEIQKRFDNPIDVKPEPESKPAETELKMTSPENPFESEQRNFNFELESAGNEDELYAIWKDFETTKPQGPQKVEMLRVMNMKQVEFKKKG